VAIFPLLEFVGLIQVNLPVKMATHHPFIKLDRPGLIHLETGRDGAETAFVACVGGYLYGRGFLSACGSIGLMM
jgi:hypothetical protein